VFVSVLLFFPVSDHLMIVFFMFIVLAPNMHMAHFVHKVDLLLAKNLHSALF